MAIRFRCRSCRRLLSIGTRKAWHAVRCPICGRDQQVPQLPSPFAAGFPSQFPRSSWSPRGGGSQSRWATWDRVFALALAAGGIAIILIVCLAVRISFPRSRQTAGLPSAESAATQKDRFAKPAEVPPGPNTEIDLASDGAFVVQPPEMPSPPNTQKPIATVPVVAPKLPPSPGIQIGKVRPAPEVVPDVQTQIPVGAFSMKRQRDGSEEELRKELLLVTEESRLRQAEIDFWKAQAEQLAQEKAIVDKDSESQAPIPVTLEKPRFNVDSIPWPVVFKEDRKLGSRVRVLAQFLERLDNNPGAQELVWTIKEALQALEGLRAGLDRYPITHLHANEARNFLDGIETSLWALKRFI